jgi:predicted ATPase
MGAAADGARHDRPDGGHGPTSVLESALVETLAGARILLLVNYRPEYRHGWGSKTYYRQVQLAPLPREHAEALLAPLLGSDPSLAPLTALLIEQTEGNPLFLEECVRSLVESNTVVGERGAYRLAADASRLRVPATVHAILAARIDRLALQDKALLQAAAVIGKVVPWTLLIAIAGLGEAELRAGLARLQSSEFIVEGQLFPDLQYAFRHALTHDVAYASLLQERRRTLHAQVVAAMERLYGHRLTEHAEALGHHAIQAERWTEALTYLRLAADKARGRSAHRQTITYLEHVPRTCQSRAHETSRRSTSGSASATRSMFSATLAEAPQCWPKRNA